MPLRLKRRSRSPYWQIEGTIRGVTVRETTGLADRDAAEALRARREWELTQAAISGQEQPVTFLAASVSYLEAGGSPRFLKPMVDRLGALPVTKVDQATIEQTARAVYPNASLATLNRQAFTPVSAVLNHAAQRGWCHWRKIERPRQPPGKVRWVTPAEALRLIEASAKHLRPLVLFLFATGARLSEALYLDWRDVDLTAGHVTFVDTKNNESRGVPLHSSVVAALSVIRRRSNQEKVFLTNRGAPYKPKREGDKECGGQIKKGFAGACRRAGIKKFTPHGCRHTWATWHYAANRDLIALMTLGGWKSERMVLRYTHINVAHLAPSIAAGMAAFAALTPVAQKPHTTNVALPETIQQSNG